jgi:thioredoxin-related protein
MKTIFLTLLFVSASVSAQQWNSDLDEAFRQAEESGRNVLLFFSIPDNCEICRRLDHDVFQSEEFLEYAKANLVLAKMDFKNQAKDKAEQLLIVEKYNKDGFFPWVVVVNKSRKVVGKVPIYDEQSPRQYLSQIRSANGS